MSIYLHFYKEGDEACEQQKNALENIIQNPQYKGVGAYRVIFGQEIALQNHLHVTSPCSLVVLKGRDEKGRAVAESDQKLLERLLNQGL